MQYLSFRVSGRMDVHSLDAVTYIQGADKYAEVCFADGAKRLHDKSLSQLERLLPSDFERIHKSYIVRFSSIRSLEGKEGSRYFAILESGESLPVGRSRYKSLRAKFE